MSGIVVTSEAAACGVNTDLHLPDGKIKERFCIDINSLVKEEKERIVQEIHLPKDAERYVLLLKESNGRVTEMDPDKPLVDYMANLAQNDAVLELKEK